MTDRTGAGVVRAALAGGHTVAATFGHGYRAGGPKHGTTTDTSAVDTAASFTSRGGTPADGHLKPDVSAPGVTLLSAKSGTGVDGLVMSGTSMATPHTAGIAALVLARHPGYTPEELKAALVNTASGRPAAGGTAYGVTRVGAGRVDALDALTTDVVAHVVDDPGAVGLGFGPVAATGPTTRTKTVVVKNRGAVAKTYALSYASAQDVPGVTFEVPPSVTVPASPDGGTTPGTATYAVTLRISDVSALRRTPDATVAGAASTACSASTPPRRTAASS